MKSFVFKIFSLSVAVFLAVSCSEREREQEPDAPNVSFTPCRQTKASNAELSGRVEVEFTNDGVQITHYDFEVTCDFTTVEMTHTFVNGVLSLDQQGSPNMADCVCYTDVSYTIAGISQEEVNVVFVNGEQVYCYNYKAEECKFENPLTDLPWLKAKIDEITLLFQSNPMQVAIYKCIYGDEQTGFLEDRGNVGFFYNCEGETLCILGGFAGENCSELNIISQELIWNINN